MPIYLILLLFSIPIYATVFQIQTIEQQINEADGIVTGHYLRKKFVQLEDGTVATQMIFKINQEYGINLDKLGVDEIIVHYPGGEINNLIVKVEGIPEFIAGENVILMIKNSTDRFWGHNLGFGTFKIINYGKEKMVINSLFPDDTRVGHLSFSDFEETVKNIKGSALKVVQNQNPPSFEESLEASRAPASSEEGKNRSIATTEQQEENNTNHVFEVWWLVLILSILGGLFRFYRKKKTIKF